MKKKFFSNLLFLLFLNLLIKPFYIFGIDRTVQNLVGAEDYGIYYALFNFSFLLNILLDLGISQFNNRNISQNQQLASKNFPGIFTLRIVLAFVYIIVTVSVALAVGYKLYELKFLGLLMLNQVFIAFILFFRSNIAGLHFFRTDSIISVLDRLLMIAFCGYLLLHPVYKTEFKIEWFIILQSISYLITAVIAFILLLNHTRFILKLKWKPVFYLSILKQSFPFALLILLMAMYFSIDKVMVERLLPNGAEQAGIYAQAYRILDALIIIGFLFSNLLFPIFSKMIKNKEPVMEIVRLSNSLLLVPTFIISIFAIVYSYQIIGALYFEHIEQASQIFRLLMFSFIPICSIYIYGTLLTANGDMKFLIITAAVALFINITFNFILIPEFQANGAAIAVLATQGTAAIIQYVAANKKFKDDQKSGFFIIFLFLIFSVLVMIGSYYLPFAWITNATLGLLSCFLLSFGMKMLNPLALFGILKEEKY